MIHDMIKTWQMLLSLILGMGCFTAAHAQDGRIPAPVSVIIDSFKSIQELPQPGWVIKEGSTPLSIQDVLKGDIKDGEVLAIDSNEKVIKHFEKYWFAIEFRSKVDLHNWLLHVENPYEGFGYISNFSEIKSYSLQKGQLAATGITGFYVPASERDFKSRHTQSLLNLSLSSGSSLILWVHINKNYTLTTFFPRLSLYDPTIALPPFINESGNLLLFGSFMMIWILSLIMFLYIRDKTSIWFLIFTTLLAVDNLTIWPSDPLTSLFYPENPKIGLYVGVWTSLLMISSLLQFSRIFVGLPMKHKKLNKILLIANWVLLFSGFILFHLTEYFENIGFNMVFMLIFPIIYLAAVTTYLILNDPLSRFMGLAILLFTIPQLIPLPENNFMAYSGLLITVVIGVGYRIKMLFQERIQAEEEKKDLLVHQNKLLEKQVADRTVELHDSLHELKSTQTQLIQQEKLASLGELTAGIAHEIQNPLNFVNNFAEVSTELVEELKQEANAENTAEVLALAADLEQNLQKINHHGQRADAIVKNMLQHSRTTAGEKQATNLNALADEYLRLAYHGLRAKDKGFNCTLDTYYDLKLPQVEVVPQDIGRVLLNLYINAFYAVQQKAKLVPAGDEAEDGGYRPTVKVSTSKVGDWVEIRVRDNGTGMPESVKSKIFQPFFTTKPTGEGTGLGLSLSYDIITKGQGGDLQVETVEGKFTELVLRLPLQDAVVNQIPSGSAIKG
jgi:signal transduction histidine kinase